MRHYLLVDDNRPFAENLAEIVRDTGDEVTIATEGAQAIELARTKQFDAVVTDMRMPVMSGAHLVHALRRIDPGLPAIVVTAYTGDDDLAAARHEGILAILPKPVPIDRLIALLAGARRNGLVAIIEDDASLCDNLSELLRDRGFSAVTARSVVETERLGPVAPFVGLVDLRVPGGNSGDALQMLETRFPGLPKLLITAFADELPSVEHSGLFVKPFETSALLSSIEKMYVAGRTT